MKKRTKTRPRPMPSHVKGRPIVVGNSRVGKMI